MKKEKISRRKFLKFMGLSAVATAGTAMAGNALIKVGTKVYEHYNAPPKSLTEVLGESAIELGLKEKNIQPQYGKNAIIVKADECGGDDAYIMSTLLKNRGYNCMVIEPEEATQENILGEIEKLAINSDKNCQTIFYSTGHGNSVRGYEEALALKGDDFDSSRLVPYELYAAMGKVDGMKAIVSDSCHSGHFVDYAKTMKIFEKMREERIIENYVTIASCPAKNTSMNSDYFIEGKKVGQLTFGLYKLLNTEEQVDLSTANIEIANKTHRENKAGIEKMLGGEDPLSFEMQRYVDEGTSFVI